MRFSVKHNGRWVPVGKLFEICHDRDLDAYEPWNVQFVDDPEDDGQAIMKRAARRPRTKRVRWSTGREKIEGLVFLRVAIHSPATGRGHLQIFLRPK